LTYLMFIQRIENVADHAKGIAQSVISLGNEECPKDILNLALKTGDHVNRIYVMAAEAMLIGDDKAANHVINEIEHFVPMRQQAEELMEQHLVKLCEEMLPKLTPETCALFGPHQKAMFCLENIFESFGKILEHSSAIAENAIDRALEHGRRKPEKETAKKTPKKSSKK
ncbi:MAG: hypothetical protein ACFFD8_08465, partial [Candidatus Thorarchaeota archaeon]